MLVKKALSTLDALWDKVFEAKLARLLKKAEAASQTFQSRGQLFDDPPKATLPLDWQGGKIMSEKDMVLNHS